MVTGLGALGGGGDWVMAELFIETWFENPCIWGSWRPGSCMLLHPPGTDACLGPTWRTGLLGVGVVCAFSISGAHRSLDVGQNRLPSRLE